ncbi:MAG: hypothetical protein LJE87_07790 [Deltaproteobacteria bacterium]|nr:hypothetical protein [Deltaproteobacteria bacterium]
MEKFNRKNVSHLQQNLSRLVKKPVHLTITDNTHSMIHIRPSNSGYKMRLHHMFLEANTGVLRSLARFVKSRNRKAPSVLRSFVANNSDKIKRSPRKSRQAIVRSKGRFFDLHDLFHQVNSEYFENQLDCPITWGANRRVRNQISIKLASYSDRTKTIRVHPALDKSYVPKYVIMGIVYHEMLHHHLGVVHRNGRKMAHTRRFRQLEARYRHYHRLQEWKEKNLHRLLGR